MTALVSGPKRILLTTCGVIPGWILRIETRVSSPVRFERGEVTRENPLSGFYPAGEGAGLAGGITSSAVDGILTAEAILRRKR